MAPEGHLQWNPGWFGGQFGGSAYLASMAVMAFPRDTFVAIVGAALCLLINIAGTTMWVNRDRLRPYPAVQCLVLLCGVCTVIAIAMLDLRGQPGYFGAEGAEVSAKTYLILLIVPAVMLHAHLLERNARRARAK